MRNSRARCVAALVMLCALLMPAVAWAQPAGVVAEGAVDGRARLIVDGTGPIAVTVDGQPQPSTTVPLLSDRLAMALVVDAGAAGGPSLQPGLSGLVDFGLAAPPTVRTALVADTTPPAVVSPLQPGAAGVLSGLSNITPRADRQTGAALDLAAAQLPREPDSPRLVVLYTTSDGTAEPPNDLAARLRAGGVVLAVVTTAADQYWAAVAAGTGGVAVGARPTGVLDAFGRVETALRTRSLVTLPAPPRRATPAVVHLGPRSVVTEIPASAGPLDPAVILAAAVAGIVAVALSAVAVVRLIRSRRPVVRRRPSQVWNVPDLAMPTVVRRRVQSALDHALALGGPVVVRGADGTPGMGVTTAMLQFAHRYRDTYEVAWWIAAQDPQLIADQMAQLAEALGVAAPTDSAEQATSAALAALRLRKRWLMVFDDAGNGRDLARFLPGGTGHVLVGSADPDWEARVVTVPPFTRAESVGLLRTRREGITEAEAEHVAKALGGVPLDVDAAGAMLAATGTSVASYVDAIVAARSAATAGPDSHGPGGGAEPGLNGTGRSSRKTAPVAGPGPRRAVSTDVEPSSVLDAGLPSTPGVTEACAEPEAQPPTTAAPGGSQGTAAGPHGTPGAVGEDSPDAPATSDPKAGAQTAAAGPHDAEAGPGTTVGSSTPTGASPVPEAGASPTGGPGTAARPHGPASPVPDAGPGTTAGSSTPTGASLVPEAGASPTGGPGTAARPHGPARPDAEAGPGTTAGSGTPTGASPVPEAGASSTEGPSTPTGASPVPDAGASPTAGLGSTPDASRMQAPTRLPRRTGRQHRTVLRSAPRRQAETRHHARTRRRGRTLGLRPARSATRRRAASRRARPRPRRRTGRCERTRRRAPSRSQAQARPRRPMRPPKPRGRWRSTASRPKTRPRWPC
ncbi:MAG: hypothetical protein JOY78_04320 [Pseudonocardia sp.]|nr:hypothetical protein [Pseudonocardia sp.]